MNNVVASVQTDVGCVREANEDSDGTSRRTIRNQNAKRDFDIVADGMGGHASANRFANGGRFD
jgi:serine/threonine protein phosphatase PrpC